MIMMLILLMIPQFSWSTIVTIIIAKFIQIEANFKYPTGMKVYCD